MHNKITIKFKFADGSYMISNMLPEATSKGNLEDLRVQYNAIGYWIVK